MVSILNSLFILAFSVSFAFPSGVTKEMVWASIFALIVSIKARKGTTFFIKLTLICNLVWLLAFAPPTFANLYYLGISGFGYGVPGVITAIVLISLVLQFVLLIVSMAKDRNSLAAHASVTARPVWVTAALLVFAVMSQGTYVREFVMPQMRDLLNIFICENDLRTMGNYCQPSTDIEL